MQVTETLSDGLKRGFTVVVPAADIEGKRAAKLAELGRTLRLPGFRPGKIPPNVVRQRYGAAVMAEVLEGAVGDATRQVLTDRGLRAAGQPKVDLTDVADGKDLSFSVEVELLPEIAMPDFAALQLTRLKAEPAEAAVAAALENIATRNRELVAVAEDRGAAKGEVVTIDFAGTIDGTPFPGGTGTGMAAEVGGTGFIPGFAEALEGMRVNETRVVPLTFPEAYPGKEVAGKSAIFTVTVTAIRQPVLPAVDDTLATKLGLADLSALRDAVGKSLQREYDGLARMRLKRALLDALADAARFPVPDTLVEAEFGQIWKRVDEDLKAGRLDADDQGKDEATLKAEYRAIAERRVRLGLLLSEIGRTNGIQVSNEEMTRAMRAEASRYPGQEQQVMELFRKNPQAAEGLRAPIFEEKVVDFVLELAKVEERAVSAEELTQEPPPKAA